ncbi:MAG: hypothetical protein JWQ40_771 [Segetibacter sp.]|jgi:hypothetical protein|nr:hypothetical protein [Segetibacter sp.]
MNSNPFKLLKYFLCTGNISPGIIVASSEQEPLELQNNAGQTDQTFKAIPSISPIVLQINRKSANYNRKTFSAPFLSTKYQRKYKAGGLAN